MTNIVFSPETIYHSLHRPILQLRENTTFSGKALKDEFVSRDVPEIAPINTG